jgi:hypothetical protein
MQRGYALLINKMDLKETRQVVVCITVDKDRAQWGFLVNALMKLQGLHKGEFFLLVKLRKRPLPCTVNYHLSFA